MKQGEDDKDFIALVRKIRHDTNFDMSHYKDNYLKRRLVVRMRATRTSSFSEYAAFLSEKPLEYETLLDDITINVTEFFRDPTVYDLLENEVLPLMISEKVKTNRKVIRLWSAGCSSGEEPYSLAILLHYLLDEHIDDFLVFIHSSDFDLASIEAARQGEYMPRQVANVRKELLGRYFDFDGHTYRISNEIKSLVKFNNFDLFAGKKGSHFDMILCRNVLIYFSKEMQNQLFTEFYDALNEGGYLVLGKTESLSGAAREKFKVYNARERIFYKKKRG